MKSRWPRIVHPSVSWSTLGVIPQLFQRLNGIGSFNLVIHSERVAHVGSRRASGEVVALWVLPEKVPGTLSLNYIS